MPSGSPAPMKQFKHLRKLVEQRTWFGNWKKVEICLEAANALALIGTPEAKAVLESGMKSKNSHIRQACLQARERIPL